MRVSLWIVIPVCLLTAMITWWIGARGYDFDAPPGAARLEAAREEARTFLHSPGITHVTISTRNSPYEPVTPPDPVEPKPPIQLGDLRTPPALDEYADLAGRGAEHLVDLAVLLETEGETQRALLAWERVIDAAKPEATLTAAAIQAIRRLRATQPDWNEDPEKRIAIVLHAGTGSRTAAAVKPHLAAVAAEIEKASAGILQVEPRVNAGRDAARARGPAPVALWFTGAAEPSRSTEVLSFTFAASKSLGSDLPDTAFGVLSAYLGRGTRPPVPPAAEDDSTTAALHSHITRRLWQELGELLNHPPEGTR